MGELQFLGWTYGSGDWLDGPSLARIEELRFEAELISLRWSALGGSGAAEAREYYSAQAISYGDIEARLADRLVGYEPGSGPPPTFEAESWARDRAQVAYVDWLLLNGLYFDRVGAGAP